MKAVLKGHLARRTGQGSGWPLFHRSVAFAAFAVVLGFPKSAFAGTEAPATIIVRMYNFAHASPATLARAERETGKILHAAGVQSVWIDCLEKEPSVRAKELCDKGWSAEAPSVRLLSGHTTNKFQDFEFGFADVPVLATVSYEHIARRAQRDNDPYELPIILGCVMAHELGHLLLGTPRHSLIGIMQAHWGRDQVRQALTGHLLFTREEASLISERARMLAALPGAFGQVVDCRLPEVIAGPDLPGD